MRNWYWSLDEMHKAMYVLAQLQNRYGGVEPFRAVACVAEEAGEFVGAWRRWSGNARRSGTFEDMEDELADVAITAFTAAESLGINLMAAIRRKGRIVMERADESLKEN